MSDSVAAFSRLEMAGLIERAQWASYAHFARSGLVDLYEDPELLWVSSDIPHPMVNSVLRTQFSDADADQRIDSVLDYFRRHRRPVNWWVGPSSRPDDLRERLIRHGLQCRAPADPGMAIDIGAMPSSGTPAPPASLQIRPVLDRADLEQWMSVFLCLMPPARRDALFASLVQLYMDVGLAPKPAVQLYMGVVHRKAVATSACFRAAGAVAIHHVVTLPAARRQGIGTAMTRAPLREAGGRGYRVGVLDASELGFGIYERIGFRTYCTFGLYGFAA